MSLTDPFARAEVNGARAMLDVLVAEGLVSIDYANQRVVGKVAIAQEALDRALNHRLPSWRAR